MLAEDASEQPQGADVKKKLYLTVDKSPAANKDTSKTRTVFTNDGVFLEKDVVAFTAANLEDEFADVEQAVSTHSQLQGKCRRKN